MTLDPVPWLREERAALLTLLDGLDEEHWALPTDAPAWTVHGVALHVLGDDLSLLSRQRDGAPSGLLAVAQRAEARNFLELLDAFNEEWVAAAGFLSPRVVRTLLQLTGEWTADWFAQVSPDRLGEPVHWLGPQPAPYWMIAAREYVERWVHHQQIARACGRAVLDETATTRAVAALALGFPRLFGPVHAPDDASVAITVLGETWTLHGPGGGWSVQAGRAGAPLAEVSVSAPEVAARAFSRGLTAAEMTDALETKGDAELSAAAVRILVEGFSRSY